jgi:hypothetical protein
MFNAVPVKPIVASRTIRAIRAFTSSRSTPPYPIYAARVGLGHRALGVIEGEVVVWFWIGTHAEYDQLLRTL